jgi:molybdopterin converting factor small subunit
VEIKLKLYGSSKMLSDKEILNIKLPNNSNVETLRDALNKIISKKYLKNSLQNLSKTAAFYTEADEIINNSYKLKNKELISIIPPIGGG